MLSPGKAITAGALAFALAGAFLIAQPFGHQGGSVPGATTDRAGLEPAFVTGTRSVRESDHAGKFYAGDFYALDDDSVFFTRSSWHEAGRLMMDDPRITGDWSSAVGINRYRSPDGAERAETYSGTITVENDAGTWVGRTSLLGCSGCGLREMTHVELVGTGAYEGLSAILYSQADGMAQLYGVIVSGDPSPRSPMSSAATSSPTCSRGS